MPEKYHVHVSPAPPRFAPEAKLASIEQDRCLGCLDCAKRKCIYDVYEKRQFTSGQLIDSAGAYCKSCMRCVQECRNQILVKALNPEYTELGDEYWLPQIIVSLWQQAENGAVPVSGAGYDGPFSGPGFDEMWTDMSEIVRPTRDGIHGREYISTTVDMGAKPLSLDFTRPDPLAELAFFFSLPAPFILDIPEHTKMHNQVKKAVFEAAKENQLLAYSDDHNESGEHLISRFHFKDEIDISHASRMIEITFDSNDDSELESTLEIIKNLLVANDKVVGIGLPARPGVIERAVKFAEIGVSSIHISTDRQGKGFDALSGEFVKDIIRDLHLRLVDESLRDRVTLLGSGGIAMAEHVPKLIACGADAVVLDDALMVALECRLCGRCEDGGDCEISIDSIEPDWGVRRLGNLIGAWHSQLLEVLGAMGIREVRRLRGEVGRTMFFEDLERECFAPIFGERK